MVREDRECGREVTMGHAKLQKYGVECCEVGWIRWITLDET